jgi:hypothetical protein
MTEAVSPIETPQGVFHGIRGKSSERGRHSVPSTSGPYAQSSTSKAGSVTWLYSTWPSIVNFAAATSWL